MNSFNQCITDKCVAGTTFLALSYCSLSNSDLNDIATCFDTVGRTTIQNLELGGNEFTTLPSDLFNGLTNMNYLSLYDGEITSLDADTFEGLGASLVEIRLDSNELTELPAGLFAGLELLEELWLSENPVTTLPTGIFDDLSSLQFLYMSELVEFTALPAGLFTSMGSLDTLILENCGLTSIDVDAFDGLTSVGWVDLRGNDLTTLPQGVFENLGSGTSLRFLTLAANEDLQCIPTNSATGERFPSTSTLSVTYLDPVANDGMCACTDVATCDDGFVCSPGEYGYTCEAATVCAVDSDCDTDAGEECCLTKLICEVPDAADPGACGDPHMTGFRGQKFDFTGEDGAWYAVVSDLPNMHLNMRVTSPVPSLPEITYITGVSIITTGDDGFYHTMVISVSDPHSMESACPVEMSSCLADRALHVIVDGEEVILTPDVVTVAPGVAIAAVNLPGECRSFGFEQYWEKKKLQLAQPGRRLSGGDVLQDMSDWVLADPTATNMMECEDFIAAAVDSDGLFEHQSEHASFQIMTPTATIRLSHGRLHQLPMRDPTDQYDLPDHLAWQMNMAIDHSDMSLDATGILGETLVPTLDNTGAPIMQGMDAIRGAQEDYRVSGPLGVFFSQDQPRE